jgi:uncharacterized membrane protein YkvA (DUF1232 family)
MKQAPKLTEEDEASALTWVNEKIWKKIKWAMGRFPLTTDLVAAFYCVTDTTTSAPARPRLALLASAIYFISPIDAIPDFLFIFGYSDDAAVLTAALATLGAYIQDSHYEQANKKLEELGLRSGG